MNVAFYESLSIGEKHLVDWQIGISGGFFTALFQLAAHADDINLQHLSKAFPEEIKAFKRYRSEEGYWTGIEKQLYGGADGTA